MEDTSKKEKDSKCSSSEIKKPENIDIISEFTIKAKDINGNIKNEACKISGYVFKTSKGTFYYYAFA